MKYWMLGPYDPRNPFKSFSYARILFICSNLVLQPNGKLKEEPKVLVGVKFETLKQVISLAFSLYTSISNSFRGFFLVDCRSFDSNRKET